MDCPHCETRFVRAEQALSRVTEDLNLGLLILKQMRRERKMIRQLLQICTDVQCSKPIRGSIVAQKRYIVLLTYRKKEATSKMLEAIELHRDCQRGLVSHIR